MGWGHYEALYGGSRITSFQVDPFTSDIEHNPFESVQPAQELYVISDRSEFIQRHTFSTSTSIATIPVSTTAQIMFEHYNRHHSQNFHGKRVLIYIHGLAATFDGAVRTLRQLSEKVQSSYDTVIAYLYPACSNPLEYGQAIENAKGAARHRLPTILRSIASVAERVDAVAHSLGAVVAMHALNQPISPFIGNVFLLGGAIEVSSIFDCDAQGCSRVQKALNNAQNIYVMYSCTDQVLPWDHLLRSGQTLGRPGDLSGRPIGANVFLINTTSVVRNHSDYFNSQIVIDFLNYAAQQSDCQCTLADHSYTLTMQGIIPADPAVCSFGVNEAIQGVAQKGMVAFANILTAPFRLLDEMALAFK